MMTRRAALLLLIGQARLAILWVRVRLGRPLPAMATALLMRLDRWAAERAVDRPWTRDASARVDRSIAERDR